MIYPLPTWICNGLFVLQSVCGLWGFSTPLLLFKSGGSLLKKGTIINLTKEKAINCERKCTLVKWVHLFPMSIRIVHWHPKYYWQWKSNTIIPSKNKWSFFQSYPEELQLKTEHFENPLAPYETVITYDMLSQSAKEIMRKNGVKSKHYSQKKLVADFRDRWVDKKIVKTEN